MNKKLKRTSVRKYIPELEQYVFQGNKLHRLKGSRSLYRCNELIVEIHASEPDTEQYFFGTRIEPAAHMCLFVCGKESLVFCLESDFLRGLTLSKAKDKDYYLFNLVAEDRLNGSARLIYKKNGKEDAYPIDITEWCVPLYRMWKYA